MRSNLAAYSHFQVFLNYPFDLEFTCLAEAMSFAVVSSGLLPVCGLDMTAPDKPRLEMLIEAIRNCRYSIHDMSRSQGEGPENFSRMNMPIEMGMAMFHAIDQQRQSHRCLFFVATPHDYQRFASDLAGLDPKVHSNDEERLLIEAYEWLRGVVPHSLFSSQPSVEVVDAYKEFKNTCTKVRGSGEQGRPSHREAREIMYQTCSERRWWDFRDNRMGMEEFPVVPISFLT